MGGPLSATLAELYIRKFEEQHIMSDTNPHYHKIKFYARYVDDTFITLKGNQRQASIFLNHLNNIHPKIKFKLETELDSKLNFLDVTITRTASNKPSIGIYRKPTQTDLVIPAHSNHPQNYKMAAFRSLIFRLLNYNLEKHEYEKEKSIIEQIAISNGYKPYLISNIIKNMSKKSKKQPDPSANPSQNNKYISINYIDKTTEKIGKVLKKAGYNPTFKVPKETIPSYNQFKQEPVIDNQRGVYKITCSNENPVCNKQYIGYTNRNFKQRFKQHNTAHYNRPDSLIAIHLKHNTSHKIEYPKSIEILKRTNNKNNALAHESYEIYKHINKYGPSSLLNKQEDLRNSVLFQLSQQIETKFKDAAPGKPQIPHTIHTPPTPVHPQASVTTTKEAQSQSSTRSPYATSEMFRRRPPRYPGSVRTASRECVM